MATQARNYKGNVVATTLAGAINASVTSVTVADGSTYPSANFWIVIDQNSASEEKIFVTTRVNSVFTVVRGGDNTAASAHDVGAPVAHVLVANDVQQLNDHAVDNTNDVHTQYLLETDATANYAPKRTLAVGYVAAGQSTTATSLSDLTTPGPQVTVTVPASGKIRLSMHCQIAPSGASCIGQAMFIASGANTLSGDGSRQLFLANSAASGDLWASFGGSFIVDGLTPGSTTFKMQYQRQNGTSATFGNRRIEVETLP